MIYLTRLKLLKAFTLFASITLLLTLIAIPVSANNVFSDLSSEHWCYNKIIDFEKKGYVSGYEDGTFRPDKTITRAEYVKIVNNFFGYELEQGKNSNFKDVANDAWYAPYINEAVERGYITGYDDGTFRPEAPIRRQEATVMLARILDIDEEEYPADHIDGLIQYSDSNEVQDWARVAIHSYSVYNFINGYEDGTLRILKNVTRAETVELLHVLEQKVIIEKEPSGGGGGGGTRIKRVQAPVIEAYEKIGNEEKLVEGWVNNQTKINTGALIKITSATDGATIYYSINNGSENVYTAPFELPDGKYEIRARAEKTRMTDSTTSLKNVEIDTVEPIASGIKHADKVQIFVVDNDKFNLGTANISGLDDESIKYAWFIKENNEYIRETVWESVQNGSEVEYPQHPGVYYLGIKGADKAENLIGTNNPFGDVDDKISDELKNESGEIPTNEPFEIVIETFGDEDISSGDVPSGDVPSGDTPALVSDDEPIEVVVKASIIINHIYNDDETKNDVEQNNEEIPGEQFTAVAKTERNYNVSGDLTITVSRKNEENVINIYYERILVNITYNCNTATSGEMSGDVIQAGNTSNLSKNKFEKTGFDFAGWSGDNGMNYADLADFTADPLDTEVELFATWVARSDTKYREEYYVEKLDGTGYEIIDSGEKLGTTDEEVTITNKVFDGFTLDENNVNNILSGDVKADGSLTLKAYYNRNDYKIIFDSNGGSPVATREDVKHGTEIEIKETTSLTGYTFAGWETTDVTMTNNKYTMPAKDVTLKAKWEVETYDIIFDTNGGNAVASREDIDYGTDIEITEITSKEGHIFIGWETMDVTMTNNIFTMPAKDVTLTAKWEVETYNIIFDSNGGSTVATREDVEYGTEVEITETTSLTGYTFAGWKVETSGVTMTNDKFTMPAKDVTLKAKWEEILPVVATSLTSNYPQDNQEVEPGEIIEYTITIVNKENYPIRTDLNFSAPGTDLEGNYEIIHEDAEGNRYINLITSLDDVVIPASSGDNEGKVTIRVGGIVDKNYEVGEELEANVKVKYETKENGIKTIGNETCSNDVEKSAILNIKDNTEKNVILVLDLSGSMDKCAIHNENLGHKENVYCYDCDDPNHHILWWHQTHVISSIACTDTVTKMNSLIVAAKEFVNKLSAEVSDGLNVTLVGIGQDNINPNISETVVSISGYENADADAFVIGTFDSTNWETSGNNKGIIDTINSLKAKGGTNITGALDIVDDILNNSTYRTTHSIKYSTAADANDYVIVLTDGANGYSGNTPIEDDDDGVVAVQNSADFLAAIAFGSESTNINSGAYADLLTITGDADMIFLAEHQEQLQASFVAIANEIGSYQSKNGKLTIDVTEYNGEFYPIIVSYGSGTELFRITSPVTSVTWDNEGTEVITPVTITTEEIEIDLSGDAFSNKENLKIELGSEAAQPPLMLMSFRLVKKLGEMQENSNEEDVDINEENKEELTSGEIVEKDNEENQEETPSGEIIEEVNEETQEEAPSGEIIEEVNEENQEEAPSGEIIEEVNEENQEETPSGEIIEEDNEENQEEAPSGEKIEEVNEENQDNEENQEEAPCGEITEEVNEENKEAAPNGEQQEVKEENQEEVPNDEQQEKINEEDKKEQNSDETKEINNEDISGELSELNKPANDEPIIIPEEKENEENEEI